MPIPSEPKVTSHDYFEDDGEFVDQYTAVHVPCPTSHVGERALNAAMSKLDPVEGEYSQADGGHVAIIIKDESQAEAAIQAVETARDNARQEHGLDPYEPTTDASDRTSIAQRTVDEDENNGPRYIH